MVHAAFPKFYECISFLTSHHCLYGYLVGSVGAREHHCWCKSLLFQQTAGGRSRGPGPLEIGVFGRDWSTPSHWQAPRHVLRIAQILTAMPFVVKLKKASTSAELTRTILARFDARPSWWNLTSKIAEEFSIPSNNVGVVFLDEVEGKITLKNEQELQSFYEVFDPSSGKIKFVVQDLQAPDSSKTISSTSSASSNISDLSKADDQLKIFCWVLNVSDDLFPVNIGRSMTVGDLKEEIKRKKEHAFGAIDPDTLNLWKLSPPIPSAEIVMKLEHVQSPQGIPGCVKLGGADELSEHFSSAPRKHLHIIVEAPPTLDTNPSQDPRPVWLVEIHKKLWGKKHLFGQIFRTANLTKADFIELQLRLESNDPSRSHPSYEAKTVLDIKAEFLREKSSDATAEFDSTPNPNLVPSISLVAPATMSPPP
ncbi:hypothetical protein AX15_007032, partial [Amanita polypyramis BW_CC]